MTKKTTKKKPTRAPKVLPASNADAARVVAAARKSGKRGPPSAADVTQNALASDLATEIMSTGREVARTVRKLAKAGMDIPPTVLSAFRLVTEWHTDYLTVQSALSPEAGEGEKG